jgi:hypothetical protein
MKNFLITFALICFSLLASAQIKVKAKCKLWNPTSLCDISDTLNIPMEISGRNVNWTTLKCQEIKKKGLQGIHIRFSSKSVSTFSLSSKFKNISLKKKDTEKIIHPYAILWYGTDYDFKTENMVNFLGYMTNRFEATEYVVTYELNKPYDLIMLFDEAAPGDNIVIDNFLNVTIEE